MPYNKKDLMEVLDLGFTPWCGDFVQDYDLMKAEEFYPLTLGFDIKTSLLQLSYFVPKERMFSQHTYISGTTKTLRVHFREVTKWVIKTEKVGVKDVILDIGSNDGTQLQEWIKLGYKNVIGVESSGNIADIAVSKGIYTIPKFFNESLLKKDLKNYVGKIKVINASGIFFHLEELDSVTRTIKKLLSPDGVFVIQFMYALDMFKNLTFDMIYHEHLYYYTIRSLEKYLNKFDLIIYDGYHSEIHSGSMVVKVGHKYGKKRTIKISALIKKEEDTLGPTPSLEYKSWLSFADKIRAIRYDLRDLLLKLKKEGKKIYGMGAPAKSCTLLHYFGITNKMIDKIVEVNDLKIDLYTPGTHIPIIKEVANDTPDYFVLLAHNFKAEIMEKFPRTKFIVPFPNIKIIG